MNGVLVQEDIRINWPYDFPAIDIAIHPIGNFKKTLEYNQKKRLDDFSRQMVFLNNVNSPLRPKRIRRYSRLQRILGRDAFHLIYV